MALEWHWNGTGMAWAQHLALEPSSGTIEFGLLGNCSEIALKLLWNCSEMNLILSWNLRYYFDKCWEWLWNSIGAALELHWNCTETPLEWFLNCYEFALEISVTVLIGGSVWRFEWYWNSTGTALESHRNCPVTALRLLWILTPQTSATNSMNTWKRIRIVLELHWICSGTPPKLL